MRDLKVPVRYYRLYREEKPYGCDEGDFHYVEAELDIPLDQSALVLVDLWSKHYCRSWMTRASEITESKIRPLIALARELGMPVIHAPSQRIAERYPVSARLYAPQDKEAYPAYASPDGAWPPTKFVNRTGQYRVFARQIQPPQDSWAAQYADQGIAVELGEGDSVVRSGSQLHKLLTKIGALHLFFAGFATNMCLQHRDYGIRAMSERGYNTILVRDCTTAVESGETVPHLLSTFVFIQEVEMKYSFSTTLDELAGAWRRRPQSESRS